MSASTIYRYIGTGVYSLVEAERITGIPRRRIRRWLEGYDFTTSGQIRHSTPAVSSSIGRESGSLALTFSDLIEVRFLDRFREYGVSWHAIRIAAARAREYIARPHPFSSRLFKTDGRTILLEILRPGDDPKLLDLVANQWELERVVSPMLYAGIDFDNFDMPARWWPRGRRHSVVIDPERSFGAPIVANEGVPTAVLTRAAVAEGSQKLAAAIYEVSPKSVRDAVAYEQSLVA